MNQTVLGILQEFDLDTYRPIVPRSLNLGNALPPRAGNLVKVVTGMRRSGKSYRLFQEMDALLEAGVPAEAICYFNFEDDRISPATPQTGDAVLEAFRYLAQQAGANLDGIYLFFDDLQEMEQWGSWLRRIVDTTKATIYISGSSSKMLSTEISTEFRGRAIDFELLPFSFRERLTMTPDGAELLKGPHFSPRLGARMQAMFDEYLTRGGFPAAQGLPTSQAIALLQSYVQRVVTRDVVERHDIARPRVAAALARRLMGLNGKQISLRKIENDLRSAGIATGRAYLADLLAYFEEAYLVFQVKEFSLSLSEKSTTRPKIYAVDPGIALASSRAGACERGQRLEDAVYLELRRRHPSMRDGGISMLHTKQHGYEIDFVVGDTLEQEAFRLIQVTESMEDEKTAQRELRALWEALDETGLEEGLLLVGSGHETIYENNGRRIVQASAWKWLLDDSETGM